MCLTTRLQRPGHTRIHSDSMKSLYLEIFPRPHCYVYSWTKELFPALCQPEPETMRDLSQEPGREGGYRQAHLHPSKHPARATVSSVGYRQSTERERSSSPCRVTSQRLHPLPWGCRVGSSPAPPCTWARAGQAERHPPRAWCPRCCCFRQASAAPSLPAALLTIP